MILIVKLQLSLPNKVGFFAHAFLRDAGLYGYGV